MKNAATQRKAKDELSERCRECGKEKVIAYWDYELEYYIYLSESGEACISCQKALECEAS